MGGAKGAGVQQAMTQACVNPSENGSAAKENAVQAGGGLNWYLSKHWGVRLIEADYVRTALPNAAANIQNDMRLSAGITYHFEGAAPAPVYLLLTTIHSYASTLGISYLFFCKMGFFYQLLIRQKILYPDFLQKRITHGLKKLTLNIYYDFLYFYMTKKVFYITLIFLIL